MKIDKEGILFGKQGQYYCPNSYHMLKGKPASIKCNVHCAMFELKEKGTIGEYDKNVELHCCGRTLHVDVSEYGREENEKD